MEMIVFAVQIGQDQTVTKVCVIDSMMYYLCYIVTKKSRTDSVLLALYSFILCFFLTTCMHEWYITFNKLFSFKFQT